MRELANELRKSGVDVINFAAGELDGDASDLIKNAAKLAIDKGCNKYTPTLGMKQLRKGIADRVSKRCGTQYGADEVGVTAGAKQALYNAAMVLFNPGDEVIIPKPYWGTFPAQVELAAPSQCMSILARPLTNCPHILLKRPSLPPPRSSSSIVPIIQQESSITTRRFCALPSWR